MKDRKTQWHLGFYAAMRMEFSANKNELLFQEELQLSRKPLQVDLFIIKKLSDKKIYNPIGHIFRRYNLVEYKSLEDNGYVVERVNKDIYHVNGSLLFPTQIIVSGEMDYGEHVWIGALTQGITPKEFEILLDTIYELKEEDEQSSADAVLDVVVNVNMDIVEKWKEDFTMNATLERIMKPEFEARELLAIEQGMKRGIEQGIEQGINITKKVLQLDAVGYSVKDIAAQLGIEEEKVRVILE